ncbi:hypothetical protein Y032_0060g3077 [Ancylostoma ceylanicum]|nr:hypothetical protein Y032_0060g3077 [Ancylostoma ceylanicum]
MLVYSSRSIASNTAVTVATLLFILNDCGSALPFLSVSITPDVYLITGTSEQTVNHKIENLSPFPVVVKVLATAPRRFSISKNNLFLDQKSSTDVEIKLQSGPVRSHRLDFHFLPCINVLNSNWKDNPTIAFSTPYKPIVKHVRYKAPRPWSSAVDELCRSHYQISENLSKVFEEAGIFSSKKESIDMNEFAILDEAFAQNLEKEPVKSSR